VRVIVCGSRNWTDENAIEREIGNVIRLYGYGAFKEITIVHGDNGYDAHGHALPPFKPDELAVRGADKLAGKVARRLLLKVEQHPAFWKQMAAKGLPKTAAGPVRNQEMLDAGVDLVIAFHPNILESKGTLDMFKKAVKAKVPIWLVPA